MHIHACYFRENCAPVCSFSKSFDSMIFQAPVSDRERLAMNPQTAALTGLASTMIKEGRGSELMPVEVDPSAPLTAYRCDTLANFAPGTLSSPEKEKWRSLLKLK